jgi:hypothetical protein
VTPITAAGARRHRPARHHVVDAMVPHDTLLADLAACVLVVLSFRQRRPV